MIGIPPGMPSYSTLGDLYLRSSIKGTVSDYRRQLDLETGVVANYLRDEWRALYARGLRIRARRSDCRAPQHR